MFIRTVKIAKRTCKVLIGSVNIGLENAIASDLPVDVCLMGLKHVDVYNSRAKLMIVVNAEGGRTQDTIIGDRSV